MLDVLGVPWVTAAGEAEAMCAFLDAQGLVDGCITNDGDTFLYGAQTVYRNFNLNSKVRAWKIMSSRQFKGLKTDLSDCNLETQVFFNFYLLYTIL